MTAVIGAPAGTNFTLRIYKKLVTNPAIVWSNFYELYANTAIVEQAALNVITAFVNFEKGIHLPSVEWDRAVLSTWIEDGEPYDPQSFITVPQSGTGARTTPLGDPQPLHVCAFVRRQTSYGQNGKVFYRRALTEGDVHAPSGTPALVGTGFATDLQTAIDTHITQYLEEANAEFELVMKSNLLLKRNVFAMLAAGVRIVQYNNRYYDIP